MNASAKGRRYEHKTMAYLEAAGYQCIRSAASGGVFDVVAVSATDVLLVQVKFGRWPGALEMGLLSAFPCPPGCCKVLHRWRAGMQVPDVRLVM